MYGLGLIDGEVKIIPTRNKIPQEVEFTEIHEDEIKGYK